MRPSSQPFYAPIGLAFFILWSHTCIVFGHYRYSLAVEKSILAKCNKIPRGGELRPFWSIFQKLANAQEEATREEVVKKDVVQNPLFLANGDSRGGALIVKKSWGERLLQKEFQNEQTTLALEPKQPGTESPEATTNEAKDSRISSMSRLWWVNLREMMDLGEGEWKSNDGQPSANEEGSNEGPSEVPRRDLSSEEGASWSEVSRGVEKLNQHENDDVHEVQADSQKLTQDQYTDSTEEQLVDDRDDLGSFSPTTKDSNHQARQVLSGVANDEFPLETDETISNHYERSTNDTDEEVDVTVKNEQVQNDENNVNSNTMRNEELVTLQPEESDHFPRNSNRSTQHYRKPRVYNVEPTEDNKSVGSINEEGPFVSSGYWVTIDKIMTLGLAANNQNYRVSRKLRMFRKAAAKLTGMHGMLSRKPFLGVAVQKPDSEAEPLDAEDLEVIRRRIAAIDRARAGLERRAAKEEVNFEARRRGPLQMFRRRERESDLNFPGETESPKSVEAMEIETQQAREEIKLEQIRTSRVLEIDRAITEGQKKLLELQCEKDALQRRPNPLYNYSAVEEHMDNLVETRHIRRFNFPNEELVDEYLSELFDNGRLVRMNHTYIWKCGAGDDYDEDEAIGDDLFTPSAEARKLYQEQDEDFERRRRRKSNASYLRRGNGGGGSWLLRQTLGQGSSLGEKIGEAVETAAYKSICTALMASLAKTVSAIHGINIMAHSDIRVFVENSPDLPPLARGVIPDKNYAQNAIVGAMREGSRKRKKKAFKGSKSNLSEDTFIQRDAVVETLISHCQISAPLLKLFPLAWQRALLGNVITLIAAVVADFCDGIQIQILGHQLSFTFKPITESDMIRHIGMAGNGFNHRRARPEEFEAAVRATAEDISAGLSFLDRWHERALGSGMLRAQVANLIARIVLTLSDEVLSGARMDLWSAQAGGPRMVAGLEYRTTPVPI